MTRTPRSFGVVRLSALRRTGARQNRISDAMSAAKRRDAPGCIFRAMRPANKAKTAPSLRMRQLQFAPNLRLKRFGSLLGLRSFYFRVRCGADSALPVRPVHHAVAIRKKRSF